MTRVEKDLRLALEQVRNGDYGLASDIAKGVEGEVSNVADFLDVVNLRDYGTQLLEELLEEVPE